MWRGDDKFKEECGVFGIFAPGYEVTRLTYYGLHALQHRGQESAGIAVSNGHEICVHKGMGLVSQVFERRIIQSLTGNIAIGHVRYSTTGASQLTNAQPVLVEDGMSPAALAHNGNITNASVLRQELAKEGLNFKSTGDSEVILKMIVRKYLGDWLEAIQETMTTIHGSYALVIMTKDKLFGIRDSYGIRPLCIGRLGKYYCLASESCALDTMGAEFVRDVEPGEIVMIDANGLHSEKFKVQKHTARCSFEYIYFARPDSTLDGLNVWESRRTLGRELAREHPVDADLVIPVPESGIPAALGYAMTVGLPYMEGLKKNNAIGRTFIQPTQALRDTAVYQKLSARANLLRNRRVIVVDDSLVRGTTSLRLVHLLRLAGVKEVHLLIASPPVLFPCSYGINTAEQRTLIAAQYGLDGVRKVLEADSLYYLSYDGLLRALGGQLCTGCFTGIYPMGINSLVQRAKPQDYSDTYA